MGMRFVSLPSSGKEGLILRTPVRRWILWSDRLTGEKEAS